MLRLVINLDRCSDRLEKMRARFEELHLPFQRLEAIDATKFTQEQVASYQLPFEKRHYYLSNMSPGEVGCYLSHIKAFETLLASHEEWALVCEDDITMLPGIEHFISNADWIPKDVNLVNLANDGLKITPVHRERELKLPNGVRLLETVTSYGGTQAYLINRKAAQELLDLSKPGLLSAIDDIMFAKLSPFRHIDTPWSLAPAVVMNNDQGVSIIGKSRTKLKSPWFKDPGKYIARKLLKWKHKLACKFVYTKDFK